MAEEGSAVTADIVRTVLIDGHNWYVGPNGWRHPAVSGGEGPADPPNAPEPTNTGNPPEGEPLGDAGKRALAAERERARTEERARKAAEKRSGELEGRLSQFEADSQSEGEKALAKARKEAAEETRATVLAEVNGERLADRIRALAGGRYNDPEDAVLHLSKEFEVGPDGVIDSAAITKRMNEHLKAKAYLGLGKTQGSADGGPQGSETKVDVAPGMGRLRQAYSTK